MAGRMWNWMSGMLEVRAALHEGAHVGGREGEQALALEQVAGRLAHEAHALGELVDADHVLLQAIAHAHGEVILQVLAHLLTVGDHGDPVLAQEGARPDPGELQELRRVDRSAAEDHLLAGADGAKLAPLPILHAYGALALEQHAGGERVGLHMQVGALHGAVQVGDGGGHAGAVLLGHLIPAHPLLLGAVQVGAAGNAGLYGRFDGGVGDGVAVGHVGHVQGAADAVHGVLAALLVLGLPEVGRHVVPRPAGAAHLAPAVVVGVLAAHVEHGVDGGRAAQHLAPRPGVHAAAGAGIGLGFVEPVDLGVLQVGGVAHGHVDHQVGHELAGVLGRPVVSPRFEQGHAVPPGFGQPVGQHAARGARAHDHVVGFRHPARHPVPRRPVRVSGDFMDPPPGRGKLVDGNATPGLSCAA